VEVGMDKPITLEDLESGKITLKFKRDTHRPMLKHIQKLEVDRSGSFKKNSGTMHFYYEYVLSGKRSPNKTKRIANIYFFLQDINSKYSAWERADDYLKRRQVQKAIDNWI
jgi:hypothetical protein